MMMDHDIMLDKKGNEDGGTDGQGTQGRWTERLNDIEELLQWVYHSN